MNHARFRMLLGLLVASTVSYAGPGAWTTAGPFGGNVERVVSVTTNPTQLYLLPAAAPGLMRSIDSGLTFARLSGPIDLRFIERVLPHPTIANRLIALTGGQLMLSTDAGVSFSALGSGFPADTFLYDIAHQPGTPTTLYVGSFEQGLYRSTDAGVTFSRIGVAGGLTLNNIGTVAVDPLTPARLLVSACNSRRQGSPSSAAMRSIDGGTTWSAVTFTVAAPPCLSVVKFSPTTANRVFAAFSNVAFVSTDGGASFAPMPGVSLVNDFVPTTGTTVLAATQSGGFRSPDNGSTWSAVSAAISANGVDPSEVRSIEPLSGTPATLFASTPGAGMWVSTDSGSTWTARNNNLRYSNIRAISVNPSNAQVLLAGTGDGVLGTAATALRSTDGGNTWTRSNSGLRLDFVRGFAIDSNTTTLAGGGTVFAGGRDLFPASVPPASRASSLARSSDGGVSWTEVTGFAGLTPIQRFQLGTIRTIAFDPTSGSGAGGTGPRQTIYLTASGSADFSSCSLVPPVPAYIVGRLWKSIDGGNNWSRLDTPASGFPQGGCMPTADVPPTLYFDNVTPVPLVVNPASPNTLYVGTFGSYSPFSPNPVTTTPTGVFKSTDGGITWTQRSNGLPRFGGAGTSHYNVLALAIDPINTNTLYAAVNPLDSSSLVGGIFKTTDGGSNWTSVSTGIVGQDIRAIVVDPVNNLRIYAASGGGGANPGGMFVSTNGGVTWASFSTALPASSATAITLDNSIPTEPTVHVGSGSGVYSFTRVGDLDADGPSNLTEGGAPGNGDGNDDGQPDGSQTNVASIPGDGDASRGEGLDAINTGPVKMTLTVTPLDGVCNQIFDAYSPKASAVGADIGRNYPLGLVRLEISNCRRAFLSVRFHGSTFSPTWAFRTYGPASPPDTNSVQWNALTSGFSGNTWTIDLQDGRIGDSRAQENAILFIGGPSQLETIFANGFE